MIQQYKRINETALYFRNIALVMHFLILPGQLPDKTGDKLLLEIQKEYIQPSLKEKVDLIEMGVNCTLASKFLLTVREKEVLQLIVNGMTNAEIAKELFLSVHTIENYRDNILLKMEVKNTAALVKKALTLGWAE